MEKEQWNKISNDIVSALTKVARKHNVTFEKHGFQYGDNECTFKVLATVNDESGHKMDVDRAIFMKHASQPYSSLKLAWLDKTFTERGHTYTIAGYKPGRKFSIVTRRDDGKTYFWTYGLVQQHMEPNKAAA